MVVAMRPALQPAVPSRRLLRFLRSQSDGIPFFNHGHGHGHGHATPTRCGGQCRRLTGTAVHNAQAFQSPPSRRLSSCATRRADTLLHAPPAFDVETILPRHLKRVRAPGATLVATNNVAASRRFASTDDRCDGNNRKKTAYERLWGPNAVRPDFRSRSTDELDDSIFTTTMTGRRAKAALEPVLRCTEVDEKGDAILTDGAFKKSELIAKVWRGLAFEARLFPMPE